jgi:glutamate formiminotransferase/formiminotetrahydrofolate cyclodeaminase
VSKFPPRFDHERVGEVLRFDHERVAEVLELLAADGAQPTGGPAAAIVAGLAATLTAAAADRSRDGWPEAGGARAQALALRRRILGLASEDAAAYAAARAALANRGGEGESESRDVELGETVRLAAEAPLQIGAVAADVAALAALVAAHGAPDVQTDAAIASLLAAAAAQSAARLVEINLVAGADPDLVQHARSHADTAARAAAGWRR